MSNSLSYFIPSCHVSIFKILLAGLRKDSWSIFMSFSIEHVLNHGSPQWFMEINISRIWGAKTWKGRKLVSSARLSESVAWSWGTATRGSWLLGSGDLLAWLVKILVSVFPWEFQTIPFEKGQWATLIYALNYLGGKQFISSFSYSLEPSCCISEALGSPRLKADPSFYWERQWIAFPHCGEASTRGLAGLFIVYRHSLAPRWGAKRGEDAIQLAHGLFDVRISTWCWWLCKNAGSWSSVPRNNKCPH